MDCVQWEGSDIAAWGGAWEHYTCRATSAGMGLPKAFREMLWKQKWGCAASSEPGALLIQLPCFEGGHMCLQMKPAWISLLESRREFTELWGSISVNASQEWGTMCLKGCWRRWLGWGTVVARRIASKYWIMEVAGIADSASGEVKELDD